MNSSRLNLVLAAACSALAACHRQPPPSAQGPPKVTVAHPHLATVTEWNEYPGRLEAVEMVEIKARASGYIQSIHFTDGSEVKTGDLLFVIDPRPYEAELARAVANRKMTESRLELAQNDLKRAESLRGSKAISEEEFDARAKAVREADASLASVESAVVMARLNLDYTQIKAPISGKIGRRMVTAGNLIQENGPQSTVLTTIVSMDPIYCYFDADERSFLLGREAHRAVSGRDRWITCELALAGADRFTFKGDVDFFDNQVDPKTGTIKVRAVFANTNRTLVPGLFARVRVPAGPAAETLLVPEVAILSDQNMKLVMTVNASNTVEPRSVTVGRQHGSDRAILNGLTPQDRVIVNGLMLARPGVPVEPQEAGVAPTNTLTGHASQ